MEGRNLTGSYSHIFQEIKIPNVPKVCATYLSIHPGLYCPAINANVFLLQSEGITYVTKDGSESFLSEH